MKKKLTLFVDKSMIDKAKKMGMNLSAVMENALAERLNVKAEVGVMPELILKVSCPKCQAVRNTSTLKRATCFKCGFTYKVYPKNGPTRIIGIVKGSRAILAKRARLV